MITKDKWVAIMRAAGFTEDDMQRWHKEFEKAAPAEHQEFLEFLHIPCGRDRQDPRVEQGLARGYDLRQERLAAGRVEQRGAEAAGVPVGHSQRDPDLFGEFLLQDLRLVFGAELLQRRRASRSRW